HQGSRMTTPAIAKDTEPRNTQPTGRVSRRSLAGLVVADRIIARARRVRAAARHRSVPPCGARGGFGGFETTLAHHAVARRRDRAGLVAGSVRAPARLIDRHGEATWLKRNALNVNHARRPARFRIRPSSPSSNG